ncbi:MAG: sensor histidine kinase [Marinirhabdus sp.]
MLAGQEKERQRLASDLHDSVGATLAAARMQFEHISKHKQGLPNYDEIIAHTGKLLETAYTEVRDLAHAKNSGVIAKNGLLPAVQKLARNASATKKLDITVEGFGLEKRLENTIEITIFRIVQELVTNIIKHAGATRASIAITQFDASINIITEDNGRGFEPLKKKPDNSMGLTGIERRVEHLEGTVVIDSTLGRGTTTIIDIPL